MQMNGLTNALYNFCQWITRLVYLNILWGLFMILGFIIFGFFPATIAMFAVVRKWIMGDTEIPVFTTFWSIYKKEFWKSNLLGLIFYISAYVIYIDYLFLQGTMSGVSKIISFPLLIVTLLYLLMLLYVFPIFVHYEIKVWQVFKNSFLLMLLNPLVTFVMLIGCILLYLIMTAIPGLIPVLGGSTLTCVLMGPAYYVFKKNQQKREGSLSK